MGVPWKLLSNIAFEFLISEVLNLWKYKYIKILPEPGGFATFWWLLLRVCRDSCVSWMKQWLASYALASRLKCEVNFLSPQGHSAGCSTRGPHHLQVRGSALWKRYEDFHGDRFCPVSSLLWSHEEWPQQVWFSYMVDLALFLQSVLRANMLICSQPLT